MNGRRDGESVGDIGEFDLIDRIASIAGEGRSVVGIGDDAAVLDCGDAEYLLATVDMLVEGVHFPVLSPAMWERRSGQVHFTHMEQLGARALAVNMSDIAAMGGTPVSALTSLALPATLPVLALDLLYEGLARFATERAVALVGGNLTRTDGPFCIDVTVLGRVPRDEVVLRSGGRPGDALLVTGELGNSAAVRLLAEASEALPELVVPEPRVRTGRVLAQHGLVHAMMDISDGLAGDIVHLCDASHVGAILFEAAIPIARSAVAAAAALGIPPLEIALAGGEDYELLIAASPSNVERISELVDIPVTRIGTVLEASAGIVLESATGERGSIPVTGWRHF